ncbi:hypothetical protein evm_011128 [Chilo suppressalis]|nr:hypothetical protein evm_011128 [Chilo suppressalis]
MAHSIALCLILKEAHNVDVSRSRRQAQFLRNLDLFTREDDYVNTYRLSEELIKQLKNEVSIYLVDTKRKGKGLSNRIKLLCALSFFANGSYQRILGKNIYTHLSQPSMSRNINEIASIVCHPDIVKKYIKFPQNASQRQALKERFFEKFQIPGVVGCIDGTFVTMIRPKENEERYYCRKEHLTNSEEVVFLLGDSGYAQRPYMMTPILGAEENSPEGHYNKLHATARNTVERTFSVLKGRFRCLLVHRVLHYHPDTVAKIVIACCVLHNICNRAGLSAVQMSQAEIEGEHEFINNVQRRQPVDQPSQIDLNAGRLARDRKKHKAVVMVMKSLQSIAVTNTVTLQWIKGHSNSIGNDATDELAKRGADTKVYGPEPFLPKPQAQLKTWLRDRTQKLRFTE